MHKGFLCIILHAHLPYVRHPEHEFFLEENWLYEALTETYIPLLEMCENLLNDGINFRITFSLSPTLIEMFNDNLLRERYLRHIGILINLSEKELYRTRGDIHFEPVVRMYNEKLKGIKYLYENAYKRDLVSIFKRLQDSGKVEIITSVATHAYLPNLSLYPEALKAQIKTGVDLYRKNFEKHTKGLWLPECGYTTGLDDYMRDERINFFFLDKHGIIKAIPLPRFGVYAPVACPSGVMAFGRDVETSKQVWSSVEGYPGDADYRDFYRDIGFDIDKDYVKSFNELYGGKTYTGLKYYRITGKTDKKEPYVIERAKMKAQEHALNFIQRRELQVNSVSSMLNIRPIITAMYDAELFGHWWFEGFLWLDALFRRLHKTKINFKTITSSEYLSSKQHKPRRIQICRPSMSSWGERGYSEVWLNSSNDYVYRHIFKSIERMIFLAERFSKATGILKRALNQAAREILLSQHSDWTFMMKKSNTSAYAKKRFENHISSFNRLYDSIISDNLSEEWLSKIEYRNMIFKDIDYRIFMNKN